LQNWKIELLIKAINHKSIKMNTISLTKFRQVLFFALTIVVLVLTTMFCSCKKSAEKAQETIMETAIGENANVDLDDQKIVIETDEGTFTSDATVKTWPKGIPDEVPEFKFGKIANLSTQNMEESKNWTLVFEEVPANALNDYKARLKEKGFRISSVSVPGAGGQVSGEKGNMFVAVMAGEDMASLTVGIKK